MASAISLNHLEIPRDLGIHIFGRVYFSFLRKGFFGAFEILSGKKSNGLMKRLRYPAVFLINRLVRIAQRVIERIERLNGIADFCFFTKQLRNMFVFCLASQDRLGALILVANSVLTPAQTRSKSVHLLVRVLPDHSEQAPWTIDVPGRQAIRFMGSSHQFDATMPFFVMGPV